MTDSVTVSHEAVPLTIEVRVLRPKYTNLETCRQIDKDCLIQDKNDNEKGLSRTRLGLGFHLN